MEVAARIQGQEGGRADPDSEMQGVGAVLPPGDSHCVVQFWSEVGPA